MTVQPLWEAQRGRAVDRLVQYTAIIALIAVLIVFSAAIPTFATPQNLRSVLVNNFALLAVVSIGMTLVVVRRARGTQTPSLKNRRPSRPRDQFRPPPSPASS